MKPNQKSVLLSFYFGSIDDDTRLEIERKLLTDSELLVEYLDLKRLCEAASEIPIPSTGLFSRLKSSVRPRSRFLISVSLAAAVAACLALIFILPFMPQQETAVQPTRHELLFDAKSELSSNSSVL